MRGNIEMNESNMGKSKLAMLMLQYEDQYYHLKALEIEIQDQVLAMGETFTVGNISAAYSKGRRSLDYATPCSLADRFNDELENFTETIPVSYKTDWQALAKVLGVEPDVTDQAPPSVKIKIKKEVPK
jgi:hypothetical protein